MCTRFKIRKNAGLSCLLLLIAHTLFSQATVSTTVLPPYDREVYNYAYTSQVTIQSTVQTDASLFIDLQGDNGVHLQTKPNYYPMDLVLDLFPQTLSSQELAPYFEFQNLVSLGTSIPQLEQYGLPPGQYQVCIRVIDENNVFISGESPLGCSNYFSINAIEPPQLIAPFCGSEITTGSNTVLFSWVSPPGATFSTTEYTVKMVELLSGQDPNQAFLSATDPAFFERIVGGQTSLLYGPTDPPLESGKTYAWQVIANDDELDPAYLNNGRSEVCWFTWKPNELVIIPLIASQNGNDNSMSPVFDIPPAPTPVSTLTGKLFYKFKTSSSSDGSGSVSTGSGFDQMDWSANQSITDVSTTESPSVPQHSYPPVSINGAEPLAGVSVSIVVTHLFKGEDNYGSHEFDPVSDSQASHLNGGNETFNEQVLGTTITGADGSFSFTNFINPHEDYGLVEEDLDISGSGEFPQWLKGDVYKVIRLKVNNQYYLSPDVNIVLNPWETQDIGTLVSLVKSYNLKVHTKWSDVLLLEVMGGKGAAVTGIELNIERSHIPDNIPENEGDDSGSGTVATALSTANGVVFKNLVQHNPSDSKDRYHIVSSPTEEGTATYYDCDRIFKPRNQTTEFPYTLETAGNVSGSQLMNILGSEITWNHELVVKEYEETVQLIPKKPSVLGKVQTKIVETKPLADKLFFLLNDRKNPAEFPNIPALQFTRTDSQGKYRFENLPMEYGGYDSETQMTKVVGPDRDILTAPLGFLAQRKELKILTWGQQINYPFNLEPNGYLMGYVVDENGLPVKAMVNVEDLAKKSTVTTAMGGGTGGFAGAFSGETRQKFAFKAPSGERKITVNAIGDNAANYSTYESVVTIPKTDSQTAEPLTIVLVKKQKRIRFKVVEYTSSGFIANHTILAGAKVTLEGIAGFEEPMIADENGFVSFVFENANSDFTFKIEPPEGKEDEYAPASYDVLGVENTAEFEPLKAAMLKKNARINGLVTVDGKALENAKVFFQDGSEQISTYTDEKGEYSLNGIAKDIGTILLTVTKSGIVSESKELAVQLENKVDFELIFDKEVSMNTIFGFDIEIIKREKQGDGSYIIREGNVIHIPSNENFKLREDSLVLPFSNVKIQKTGTNDDYGTPMFEPVDDFVLLNDKTVALKLNGTFNTVLGDESAQLKLIKNNNKGQIKGKVQIENNSFNSSAINFGNDNSMNLTKGQGNTDSDIIALAVDNPKVDKYGIVNKQGEEFTFKLGNFEALAKSDKSYLSDSKITLYTHLKTQEIQGLTPKRLELEAGDLVVEPTKIHPINTSNALKFKLEQWNFEAKKWSFDPSSIQLEMADAIIKTGSIDIPAKNVSISSSKLIIQQFSLNELSLGGVANLDVVGNSASFGLNPSVGSDNGQHWELRITGEGNQPAARLDLPGFETGKSIDFNMVSVLSNGEQNTATANNESLKFYNIINVQPTNISSGDGYIDIASMTDLGIPKIPESAGFIRFTKENGKVIAQVAPVPFTLEADGNVKLSVGNKPENTEIRNGFFKAKGMLTDDEGIRLDASIQKTTSKTHIEIEKGQQMKVGNSGTSFKDIKGKIELDGNNDWKKLVFSGELAGFKGVTPGQRQTFTVHGDITADSESLDIDNIETPFGDMALTYDLENARFLGNLNVNQSIGGMNFVGSLDLLMGSEGWYFSAGGTGTPPGFGEISVGLIVGDSDHLPQDVKSRIMQYAYDKNVPATIENGVSGLFVTGQKALPIINIPDWSIDLGVVSASIGAKAGLDARVWMNFDESNGDEYGIGAMVFAVAYLNGSSSFCTNIHAEGKAELGVKGYYQTSTGNFSMDGCGSMSVGGRIKQCFPIPFVSCANCVSWGITKGIKVNMGFDSSGKNNISFGFGNCSD